jgi:hypothetical protein
MLQRTEMKTNAKMVLWLLFCLGLLLSSCTSNVTEDEVPLPTEQPETMMVLPDEIVHISDLGLGAGKISGTVKEETLNWVDQPMNQYAAMLVDAIPFLTAQADLSDLKVYETSSLDNDGSYSFDLPQQPTADKGIQVMMLAVEDHDCLIPGNQLFYCWDAELSSIAFKDVSQSKVMDGQLLVWAADDRQRFPESIGADDLFFTEDDEMKSLEPGYTLIDLGAKPFSFDHQGELEMALYSNYDPSIRDLSELTYTEAFERIFNDMQVGYAFNGVEGKEPDWDAVYELIYPQVQIAEESGDVNDWISALNAFTQQFSDSHVSISGDVVDEWVEEKYSHGLVYYFTSMSNGDIIYTHGPMDDIERGRFTVGTEGDILVGINSIPVEEEMKNINPLFGSYSNPEMYYRAQVHDISHIYNEKQMKYQLDRLNGWAFNLERVSYGMKYSISAEDFHSVYYSPDLPITFERLSSGVGLITIHPDESTMQETMRLFHNALNQFSTMDIDTLILDLRESADDRFMNYAGYFSDTDILLGEMQWKQFGLAQGKQRMQSLVAQPQESQYNFEQIAILTGEYCKDACEADVYSLSLLPQSKVYASTSTFGSYSITLMNPFLLPNGINFNYSIGYTNDANGALMIEGAGVQKDVLLEESISTYLLAYDWRLRLTNDLLSFAEEMEVIPESIPQPVVPNDEVIAAIIAEIKQRDIEYLALDVYPEILRSLNYDYRVFVEDPGELIISEKWCTDDPDLYLYKAERMDIEFIVDGLKVDEEFFITRIIHRGNNFDCWVKLAVLKNWNPGNHLVKINSSFSGTFFDDGANSYRSGTYTEEYTVVVKGSE